MNLNFSIKQVPSEFTEKVFRDFLIEGERLLSELLSNSISEENYFKTLAESYLKTRGSLLAINNINAEDILKTTQLISGLEHFIFKSFARITETKTLSSEREYSFNLGGSVARDEKTPCSDIDFMFIATNETTVLQTAQLLEGLFEKFKKALSSTILMNYDDTFAKFILVNQQDVIIYDKSVHQKFMPVRDLREDRKALYHRAMLDFKAVLGNGTYLELVKSKYGETVGMATQEYLEILRYDFNLKQTSLDDVLSRNPNLPTVNVKDVLRQFQYFVYFTKIHYAKEFSINKKSYPEWINELVRRKIVTKIEAENFIRYFKILLTVRSILEIASKDKVRELTFEKYELVAKRLKLNILEVSWALKNSISFISKLFYKYSELLIGSPYL